jgi:hypothetical protein
VFGNEQLTGYQQRKTALIQESAANRRALVREAQNLRPVFTWVDLGIDVVRKVRGGWSMLTPLLSLWPRRNPDAPSMFQKFAGAISFATSVMAMWKSRG